jgi:hypothetical protein
MTIKKLKAKGADVEALVGQDQDLIKTLMKQALQEVLEIEMRGLLGRGAVGAQRRPARLSCGLLRPGAHHPHRQARAQGAARSQR